MLFYKTNYLMMTAGPTTVAENVLKARSFTFGNPDLDSDFFSLYRATCYKLSNIFKTKKSKIIIMSGEGMLGLDSACASLTEKGDRVLVISNGFFGSGFKELIEVYGGEVTVFESDWKKSIDFKALEAFLEKDSNFKYATLVHCDTPSGILNDIAPICKLLKSKNILTVVDTVAALGGVDFNVDDWKVDIALGASQKAFSAAPGLTILSVSNDAWKIMEERSTPIPSFYCNLFHWKNCVENKLFPYTMPISDILSLGVAIDNILFETLPKVYERHEEMKNICLERLKSMGCSLYLESDFSPTVTAFIPPEGISSSKLIKHMKEKYNILLSGSYGPLSEKIVRIGHMGENAQEDKILLTLESIKKSIFDLKPNK